MVVMLKINRTTNNFSRKTRVFGWHTWQKLITLGRVKGVVTTHISVVNMVLSVEIIKNVFMVKCSRL